MAQNHDLNLLPSSILDEIVDGVAYFDAEDRFISGNKIFRDVMGDTVDIASFRGQTFEQLVRLLIRKDIILGSDLPVPVNSEDWVRHRLDIHKKVTGKPLLIYMRNHHWYSVLEKKLADGSRLALWRDVTPSQSSHQMFDVAINALTDGFALFDAHDKLQVWNRAFGKILANISESICVGADFDEIFAQALAKGDLIYQDEEDPENNNNYVLSEGKPLVFRTSIPDYYVQISIHNAQYGTENAQSRVVLMLDVSEIQKHRLEQKKQEKLLEVQSLRLAKLARDFQSEKDKAQMANRAKSDFLAMMSHEIRTPMNGVLGMLGLLADSELNDEQQRHVSVARQSAEALLTIINDILDLTKLEAGKMEFEEMPFILSKLVESIADLMAPRAYDKDCEFLVYIDPIVADHWIGDPGRIRQVIMNLTSNAIKFTQAGTISLAITYDDKHCLKFVIEDTGIGIDPETCDMLFSRFTQADSSVARKFGGTGLGLAISKQLVDNMHGKIGVHSVPGKGSQFWFTIDIQKNLADAKLPVTSEYPALKGRRIGIYSPNPAYIRLMGRFLSDLGVEPLNLYPIPVLPGMKADLVLLDGIEPIDSDITNHIDPDVPLICMSNSKEVVCRCSEDRKVTKLLKPVMPKLLANVMHAILLKDDALLKNYLDKHLDDRVTEVDRDQLIVGLNNRKLRLLLAEDNQVNRLFVIKALEKRGFKIDVASNGLDAVNAVRVRAYDLILMDVQMPEMDGIEATQRIRQLPNGAQTPIIALTAHAMSGDRERFLAAGMNDYLSKPVNIDDLHNIILKWMKDKIILSDDQELDMTDISQDRQADMTELPQIAGSSLLPADIAVLDFSQLDSLLSILTSQDIMDMLSLYMTESQARLERMQAIEDDDAKMAHEAHDLKSNSGNFGIRRVETLARTIEYICSGKEDKMPLPPLLAAIQDEYQLALQEIENWKQKNLIPQ